MASVEFRHVSKIYPDHIRAITDLSLQIDNGECMVLVGPSGCGKSTALRMLAGLEDITEGEIFIGGEPVNNKSPRQRNIAMVFQNYALYPHMTVRQNLEFPLRMRSVAKKDMDRQVGETAELLGLTPLLDRRPKNLSGGQRQRVAMGRAIVRHPDVFLMDEPLSNLDAKLRVQIRSEIAALQRRMATTTLYVTHDQIEAMTLGDRVAVLRDGKCQQVASPQELYDRPANTFVAGFIGSPGMNIFRSRIKRMDQYHLIEIGEQRISLDAESMARYPCLEGYIDQPLLTGLRPEALFLGDELPQSSYINVNILGSEHLGNETLIYFCIPGYESEPTDVNASGSTGIATDLSGGKKIPQQQLRHYQQPMAARIMAPLHKLQAGTGLRLGISPGRLYFFTPDGEAIY